MQLRAITATLAVAIFAGAAIAGPLNPPPGPIQSTMKSLAEVEPRIAINSINTPGDQYAMFRITQPGSYYLTSDIVGEAGKGGIWISNGNVKIDLNGFSIRGVTGSGSGIAVAGSGASYCEVSNGAVWGWGGNGVQLAAYNPDGCVVRNVQSYRNGGDGISVSTFGRVENSAAMYNGGGGILAGQDAVVLNSQAVRNTGDGIAFSSRSTIDRCIANENGGRGIRSGWYSTVTDCVAAENTSDGFDLSPNTRTTHCVASENDSYGFRLSINCSMSECTSTANGTSAVRVAGPASNVIKCTLQGVAAFPVVAIDSLATGARIADNTMMSGTYAVSGTSAASALVTGNHCIGQTAGAFNLHSSAQIGATVNAVGTVGAVSPFANFVR